MAEKLTDVELSSIQLHDARPRHSSIDTADIINQEDEIETAIGIVKVAVQGTRSKPAIVTYHDIGLNAMLGFHSFFAQEDMQPILRHFCVYHVTAPGQHEGALPLPQGLFSDSSGMKHSESDNLLTAATKKKVAMVTNTQGSHLKKRTSLGFTGDPSLVANYQYPTMDNLAEMLLPVMQFYSLRQFIGFGIGAGANILARFALKHADKVEALVMVNCSSGKASWSEWGYQKVNSWHLKSGSLSQSVEDYLLWHWFGSKTMSTNHDLMVVFSDYIRAINPQNLAHFIESYIKRTDLNIVRETDPLKKSQARNFRCPVMLVAGENSPHLDQVVHMNSRLDPANSTWMKFECGGMVLEEAPEKMIEAFRLFLQGLGHVPTLSQTKIVHEHAEAVRRASLMSGGALPNKSNLAARRASQPVRSHADC